MSPRHPLYRRVLRAAVLLWLAALVTTGITACASGTVTPKQARSGIWRGETAFGSFSFEVCEAGGKVTAYTLQYTVGGVTQALRLGIGDQVLIDDEGNSFDLSRPEEGVTFRGQFSADGKSASGVWEVSASGETVSGEWAVER